MSMPRLQYLHLEQDEQDTAVLTCGERSGLRLYTDCIDIALKIIKSQPITPSIGHSPFTVQYWCKSARGLF